MLNYDYQQTDNYLTEKNLGDFLCEFLQGYEVIHNKKVPDSNIQKRPDYRIEELGLIIEYDGDRHFKSSEVIKTDLLKEQVYKELGYTVIRIPYFLCLTSDVIYELFNEHVDIDTDKLKDFNLSGHGFITEKSCATVGILFVWAKTFQRILRLLGCTYRQALQKD